MTFTLTPERNMPKVSDKIIADAKSLHSKLSAITIEDPDSPQWESLFQLRAVADLLACRLAVHQMAERGEVHWNEVLISGPIHV